MSIKHNKRSFFHVCNHFRDVKKNLGHDYHGDILHRVVAKELFSNPTQDIPFRQIERLIERLIDSVKQIKLHFSITHDKDDLDIN